GSSTTSAAPRSIPSLPYTTLFRSHRRGTAALAALRVEQILVQRAGVEDLALLGGHRAAQTRVELGERVPHRLASGPLDQGGQLRSEEHTPELQSRGHLVCRLLLEK